MESYGGLVVTGVGQVVLGAEGEAQVDPVPFLKARKNRKFMGRQDDLAVVAAGRALKAAGLSAPGERAGLYLAVGYIPFEQADIAPVLADSLDGDRFSLRRFGEEGIHRAHPLLTFRCLPNMPAFHVSMNFDIQGPYLVTYPGAGQLYLALDEAAFALRLGKIDAALVLGVAHQRNFLVEHHFGRLREPVAPDDLRDAAGCLVIERAEAAAARGARPLVASMSWSIAYEGAPSMLSLEESFEGARCAGELGAASLPVAVARACEAGQGGALRHRLRSRDGLRAESAWALT